MSSTETGFNEESILITIKKLLGVGKEYDAFDTDIITHINTVFSNLTQMGVGPETGFVINSDQEKWSDYEISDKTQQIKTYIYTKVKLLFDPPSNGNLLESLNKTANELEYRLYVEQGGH